MRPAVPVYWRATPTDFSPFFRKPVSSTMSTPLSSSPRCSMTYSRRSSRTASASQRAAFRRRCAPWGPISYGIRLYTSGHERKTKFGAIGVLAVGESVSQGERSGAAHPLAYGLAHVGWGFDPGGGQDGG